MDHFNKLSPAEQERLVLLMEESGEVIQICSKILRHGYESYHPKDPMKTSNRILLSEEIGHIMHACDRMYSSSDINENDVKFSKEKKAENIIPFLHHN